MAKPKVYIESSTISFLTARPTKNPLLSVKQLLTRQWWMKRDFFDPFISETVVEEIEKGNADAAKLRVEVVEGIPILAVNESVKRLANKLLFLEAVPEHSEMDAYHIALATVYGMDYLVTWNQKHIAAPRKRRLIDEIAFNRNLKAPLIITPEEFLVEIDENISDITEVIE